MMEENPSDQYLRQPKRTDANYYYYESYAKMTTTTTTTLMVIENNGAVEMTTITVPMMARRRMTWPNDGWGCCGWGLGVGGERQRAPASSSSLTCIGNEWRGLNYLGIVGECRDLGFFGDVICGIERCTPTTKIMHRLAEERHASLAFFFLLILPALLHLPWGWFIRNQWNQVSVSRTCIPWYRSTGAAAWLMRRCTHVHCVQNDRLHETPSNGQILPSSLPPLSPPLSPCITLCI